MLASNSANMKKISPTISIDSQNVVSHGSDGVQILRGVYNRNTTVAVKRILRSTEVKIHDEVNLLMDNAHDHIVKYYDYALDNSF